MAHSSLEVPGLSAHLDRLVHHHGGTCLPEGKPHAFVYFITIKNESDRAVTLLGRKWMILHEDGSRLVIEGEKIVGESPRLAPGARRRIVSRRRRVWRPYPRQAGPVRHDYPRGMRKLAPADPLLLVRPN